MCRRRSAIASLSCSRRRSSPSRIGMPGGRPGRAGRRPGSPAPRAPARCRRGCRGRCGCAPRGWRTGAACRRAGRPGGSGRSGRVTSRATASLGLGEGPPSGRSATTTMVDPLPRSNGTTRARRRPCSRREGDLGGLPARGVRAQQVGDVLGDVPRGPGRAAQRHGTRCSASWVTSTALRVDGTSADSRSRASVALAGVETGRHLPREVLEALDQLDGLAGGRVGLRGLVGRESRGSRHRGRRARWPRPATG